MNISVFTSFFVACAKFIGAFVEVNVVRKVFVISIFASVSSFVRSREIILKEFTSHNSNVVKVLTKAIALFVKEGRVKLVI